MNTVRFLAITLIFSFIFGLQPCITLDADAKGAKGKGATSVKAKANSKAKPKTSVSKQGKAKKPGKIRKGAKKAGQKVKKGVKNAKAKAKQSLQKVKQAGKKGLQKAGKLGKRGLKKTAKIAKGAKDSAKKARDKLLSKLKRDRKPANEGAGRQGKQQRLRDLAKDHKASSADRGWVKQEINSIDRGNRKTIRNPPGKDLAHERGREAAKGYSYKHSNIQDRKLHRLQHKYDNFGQKNKERPPE